MKIFNSKLDNDRAYLNNEKDVIVWMGHAAFFIRINGFTIITDPCYSNLPGIKRKVNIPFRPASIKQLDYLLLSHNHRDHADMRSLKEIYKAHPNVKAKIPLKAAPLFKKFSTQTEEAGWFQQYNTSKGIQIFYLPARHWCRRGLTDFNTMLWGSFMIQAGQHTIYFAGDTGRGSHFPEIKALFPEIDYVLMPIGAYSPSYMMQPQHVNPVEAVEAANLINAKNFVPMHYGTYDLSDEPVGEPIKWLRQLKMEGKLDGNLHDLLVGQPLYL